jgi:hypothetical protein
MAKSINVTPASQVATVEVNNRAVTVSVQKELKLVDITIDARSNIAVDISRAVSQTGVQKIIAGNNITISPSTGVGEITINAATVSNVAYANRAGSAATVDGWVKVPFTFSDASPKIVTTIPANAVVSQVEIIITTPFTDTNAKLSVGTVASSNELVSFTDNLPSQAGTYTTVPGRIYLSETHVVLTIVPGSSYTGSGMLIIYY